MRGLRLSQQLLLVVGTLLLVVGTLVGWNIVVTRQFTEAHRSLIEVGLPAVRMEVSLLESVGALRRIEARYAVLKDAAFRQLFTDRVAAAGRDLDRLAPLLSTDPERVLAHDARLLLAEYDSLVGAGRPAPAGARHPALQLEDTLTRLYERSGDALQERQARLDLLAARTRRLGAGALAAFALVGAGLAAFAVVRVARPLERLRRATQAVAERNFSEPIPASGPSEIVQLTEAFNQMASRLGELDRIKDAFFTAVSHDLRTPLAAIRWSADLLQTGALGPLTPKQARLAETIQSSSRRLLALVSQILELSRFRAGRLSLDVHPLDLRRVVAEAVDEIRPLAERSQLVLDVDCPEHLPRVSADAERLHQVVANLLGNAVRFTPAGGRVAVQAAQNGSEVFVHVADTGVGIPADLLPKIFDPYEQAHAGRGGSGIGLTVVRALVEAHGGRVSVESKEGQGTRFTFSLPMAAPGANGSEPHGAEAARPWVP